MKRLLVGGPLLGRKDTAWRSKINNDNNIEQKHGHDIHTKDDEDQKHDNYIKKGNMNNNHNTERALYYKSLENNIIKSWIIFEPIITDPILSISNNAVYERFILLPNPYYISVLSYRTGKRIATLLPSTTTLEEVNGGPIHIACATIATYADLSITSTNTTASSSLILFSNKEQQPKVDENNDSSVRKTSNHVLLVGCSNGTIQEYNISTLLLSIEQGVHHMITPPQSNMDNNDSKMKKKTSYNMDMVGPCIYPQRIIQVTDSKHIIQYISVIQNPILQNHILLYAFTVNVKTESSSSSSSEVIMTNKNDKNDDDDVVVEDEVVEDESDRDNKVSLSSNQMIMNSQILRILIPSSNNDNDLTKTTSNVVDLRTSNHTIEKKMKFIPSYIPSSSSSLSKNVNTKQQHGKDNDEHNNKKHNKQYKPMPFQMMTILHSNNDMNNNNSYDVIIIIASATTLSFYYDPLIINKNQQLIETNTNVERNSDVIHMDMISLYKLYDELLSTITISPNNNDIACGHTSGAIRILIDIIPNIIKYFHNYIKYKHTMKQYKSHKKLLKSIEKNKNKKTDEDNDNNNDETMIDIDYNKAMMIMPYGKKVKRPKHPFDSHERSGNNNNNGIITRKLHWHSHPVLSLQYDYNIVPIIMNHNDGMLYSGGEESVLVTWQLSNGSYKPIDFLPRIAKGSIIHLLYSTKSSNNSTTRDEMILVYCEDNTLQLFDSRNKNCKWKIQGLATNNYHNSNLTSSSSHAIMKQQQQKQQQQQQQQYPSMNLVSSGTSIMNMKRQQTIIVSRLHNAPGYIHWYDTKQQNVIASLEVVPYNRISRISVQDNPLPTPSITHTVWSSDHSNDLITIDIVPTENSSIGRKEYLSNGQVYGVTSTIRFWATSQSNYHNQQEQHLHQPYEQVASMIYPHGRMNRVTAIAISSNGYYACTVSNDEKAFRLWQKYRTNDITDDDNDDDSFDNDMYDSDDGDDNITKEIENFNKRSEWYCRCKVKIPAAFSNYKTGTLAVSYSHDGTVLVICFGTTITLWDFHSVTLLACHRHGDTTIQSSSSSNIIDQIQLIQTNKLHDVILSKSLTCVVMQSSYGEYGPNNFGWIWELPYNECTVHVSYVEYIASHNIVATALFDKECNQSCVVLVNGITGELYKNIPEAKNGFIDGISGEIISLLSAPVQSKQAVDHKWVNSTVKEASLSLSKNITKFIQPICLYALTTSGEMIALSTLTDHEQLKDMKGIRSATFNPINSENETIKIPSIPLLSSVVQVANHATMIENNKNNINKRPIVSISDLEDNNYYNTPNNRKKMSLYHFSSIFGDASTSISSTDLPRLHGEFARSFIARNLQRRSGGGTDGEM